MLSGNRTALFRVLAGVETGTLGSLALLGYLMLDSAWRRRSLWSVANLLASLLPTSGAARLSFCARALSGAALLIVVYGTLGALFRLAIPARWSRLHVVLLGLLWANIAFYLTFRVLWGQANPRVLSAGGARALWVAHLAYGGMLGWRSARPTAFPGAGGPGTS